MEMECLVVLFWGIIPMSIGSIARGKPSSQGSVYVGFDSHSGRAVDGNYGTDVYAGACACLGRDNSWWTVDLLTVFFINSVVIYNRATWPSRLDDLYVEAFIGDPFLCPTSSSLCGINPGPSGDVVTIDCANNTLARYIRLSGTAYMALCEVDIFGKAVGACQLPAPRTMKKQMAQRVTETSIQLGTAPNATDCLLLCQHRPHCSIFNYNVVNGSCIIPEIPLSSSIQTADDDWNLYYTC